MKSPICRLNPQGRSPVVMPDRLGSLQYGWDSEYAVADRMGEQVRISTHCLLSGAGACRRFSGTYSKAFQMPEGLNRERGKRRFRVSCAPRPNWIAGRWETKNRSGINCRVGARRRTPRGCWRSPLSRWRETPSLTAFREFLSPEMR